VTVTPRRRAKKQTDDDHIRAYFETLRRITVSDDGPYTRLDRFRDFAKTFGTVEGKRALSQIIDYCEEKVPREDEPDAAMRGYVARRRVGLWIASMLVPPRQVVVCKK